MAAIFTHSALKQQMMKCNILEEYLSAKIGVTHDLIISSLSYYVGGKLGNFSRRRNSLREKS